MKKAILLLTLALVICLNANAAYLKNIPQTILQPNGDTLRCFATGDEFYHWLHDADGYTIILNAETGYFVYADKINDILVPTEYVPGRVNPAEVGLRVGLNISADQKRAKREAWYQAVPQRSRNTRTANTGSLNNVVIFIRFADESDFTNSYATVESMFNNDAQGATSMHNYFQAASYGQLDIETSFYPAPNGDQILSYQDTYERSYFQPQSSSNPSGYTDDNDRTSREFALLKRAVDAVAASVPTSIDIDNDDDGYVDNVCFVVRGDVDGWNDLLWPHRWSLYDENAYINGKRVWDFNFQLADAYYYFNVSTLCHEMNHSLGAPDLYHYYESNFTAVGSWDLMEQNANPPQHMGAYMKYKYGGWIDEIPEITSCGTYSLYPLGASATHNCYKIASANPNEFFVLEYRNKNNGFETALPGSGLLIYRINTNFNGNAGYDGTSTFDEVYLYRPGGTTTTNGNINQAHFSNNTGRTSFTDVSDPTPFLTDGTPSDLYIHSITNAGGDSIMFSYCQVNFLGVNPTSITLLNQDQSNATFNITSDMNWQISGMCDWLTLSDTNGFNSATITVTANSANNSFEERTCTLTITGDNGVERIVTITQSGITPYLVIQQITASLQNTLTDTVFVDLTSNMSWDMSAACDWLEFSPQTGTGNISLGIYATELNPDCEPRSCLITVTGESGIRDYVTVTQGGMIGELSTPITSYQFDNVLNQQIILTINSNTSWTISGNDAWLGLSQTSGTGDTEITMTSLAYNDLTEARYCTLLVETNCNAQMEVSVSQEGVYLYTSETALMLDAPMYSADTLTVFANRNWQINNIPDWVTVSPSSGTGEREVVFSANTGNDDLIERAGIMRISSGDLADDILIYQNSIHTGISDMTNQELAVFPNPAENDLTIVLPSRQNYQYNLVDVTGKSILTGSLTDEINHINLNAIHSGVYFIRLIDSDGQMIVKKVIKR